MERALRILVLDNDPPRHEMFRAAAWDCQLLSTYEVITFAAAVQEKPAPDIICLDHDLKDTYNSDGRPPESCGCDAADLVVAHIPATVPVLIHSSNAHCAQIMRRILLQGRRSGRIATVNTATVSSHSDEAGVETLRSALEQLISSPTWPEDLSTEELLQTLCDVPDMCCPVRISRSLRWQG